MKEEKGNALFLILIAVALFAALSYAVTQSSGGSGSIKKEENIISAAKLINYAGSLDRAFNVIRIINNCQLNQVSFHDDGWGHTLYQYPIPVATECRIFGQDGGGAEQKDNWHFYALSCIPDVGTGGTSCDSDGINNEEIIALYVDLNIDTCMEINKRLGITNPSGAPPNIVNDIAFFRYVGFNGDFRKITDPGEHLHGNRTGCFTSASGALIRFYHAIYAG